MKKNTIILIFTIILIILIVCSIIVYGSGDQQKETMEEKISKEIEYINKDLVSLLGLFNNLEIGQNIFQASPEDTQIEKQADTVQSNKSNATEGKNENTTDVSNLAQQSTSILANNGKYEPQWDKIKIKLEELYRTWNTISLDLHAMNIDGTSVLAFSDLLNTVTENTQKKNKEKAMEGIASLFELLPQYQKSFWPNEQSTQLLDLNSQFIRAYVLVTNEDWAQAETILTQSEQQFSNLINSVTINGENQSVINQSYILVNELRKAVSKKNKEIFYIHFQNLITKIGILT